MPLTASRRTVPLPRLRLVATDFVVAVMPSSASTFLDLLQDGARRRLMGTWALLGRGDGKLVAGGVTPLRVLRGHAGGRNRSHVPTTLTFTRLRRAVGPRDLALGGGGDVNGPGDAVGHDPARDRINDVDVLTRIDHAVLSACWLADAGLSVQATRAAAETSPVRQARVDQLCRLRRRRFRPGLVSRSPARGPALSAAPRGCSA